VRKANSSLPIKTIQPAVVSSLAIANLLVRAHREGTDIGDLLAAACRDAARRVKDDLTKHRTGSWEAELVRALSAGWDQK
jgi:hypothetical protein